MAIITWDDDGSQYYVPDAVLYGNDPAAAWAAAVPLAKYQLQQRIAELQSQLQNFPEPSEAELLDFARQNHHAFLARRQIEAQLETMNTELDQWPSQ